MYYMSMDLYNKLARQIVMLGSSYMEVITAIKQRLEENIQCNS